MVRFLQTGDWQLGMARHYFSAGVQERFTQARFDAIRTLGRIAGEENCDFVAVCGDMFDSNLVDRKTAARAIEALREVPVPVFVLPGNHDPLDASSIYLSKTFAQNKPGNVIVLDSPEPVSCGEGAQIVGVPWFARKADRDLVSAALSKLEPVRDRVRIVIAHGILDAISPDPDEPSAVSLASAESAIAEGRIGFLALGDRHSTMSAGSTGRVWYAGSPEPTDFREDDPGNVLVVEIAGGDCRVAKRRTSTWSFVERDRADVNSAEEIELLRGWLDGIADKERTAAKIRLSGTLSLFLRGRLETILDHGRDLLAALEIRENDLVTVPDDEDFSGLALSGFAALSLEKLRASAKTGGEEGRRACDALALLLRLHRGVS